MLIRCPSQVLLQMQKSRPEDILVYTLRLAQQVQHITSVQEVEAEILKDGPLT